MTEGSYKSDKVISFSNCPCVSACSPLLSSLAGILRVSSSPLATPIVVSCSLRKQLQRSNASKQKSENWVLIFPGRFFYYPNQSWPSREKVKRRKHRATETCGKGKCNSSGKVMVESLYLEDQGADTELEPAQ